MMFALAPTLGLVPALGRARAAGLGARAAVSMQYAVQAETKKLFGDAQPYTFMTIQPTFTVNDWGKAKPIMEEFVTRVRNNEGGCMYYGWSKTGDKPGDKLVRAHPFFSEGQSRKLCACRSQRAHRSRAPVLPRGVQRRGGRARPHRERRPINRRHPRRRHRFDR